VTYKEPDISVCTIDDYPIPLAGPPEGYRLDVNLWSYRKRIVRFAISLTAGPDQGSIERIDTCHGQIHRHSFDRSGDETECHLYEEIPDWGWVFVDRAYTHYYELAVRYWPEWVRRWAQ